MTRSDIDKIRQMLIQISTNIKKSDDFDYVQYIEKYIDIRVFNWFQENILKDSTRKIQRINHNEKDNR